MQFFFFASVGGWGPTMLWRFGRGDPGFRPALCRCGNACLHHGRVVFSIFFWICEFVFCLSSGPLATDVKPIVFLHKN